MGFLRYAQRLVPQAKSACRPCSVAVRWLGACVAAGVAVGMESAEVLTVRTAAELQQALARPKAA